MKPAFVLALHRRLALVFAPLLLLQALTGMALAFHAPLARLADPAAMVCRTPATAPAVPVSALRHAAERAFPGYQVSRLFFADVPQAAAFAQLSDPAGRVRYVTLDPGDGRVLAAGTVWRFPFELALQLHYRLLAGSAGLVIVTLNGVALALIAGTGLWQWWPGRGRVLAALKIRKGLPARLRLRQQHRSFGAMAAVVALFSAMTGLALAIPDLAWPGAAPGAVPSPTPVVLADPRIDAAIALAARQFPDAPLRDVRFGADGVLAVNLFAASQAPRAFDTVRVDARSGVVLASVPAAENPALWTTALPLHTGETFGMAGRLVILLEAAVLVFLSLSGPLLWWRARATRRARTPNQGASR
ncbi:PepSY-associated TM helix domain-containing protein [Novosphingobium colocasiae]|uniref:PepSY domain-containing protein n=1 Tax=Novosphingobium colocasiae TaxID=1256513 RepID=A0A918PHB6_9SPHN|nr:PepSY-associated TM helix domain-containing protein [Novosphingobium colocasiae]GGZ07939.1 hypothetical protein GCM10011614_23610 [Novosphingobium colocasiae]